MLRDALLWPASLGEAVLGGLSLATHISVEASEGNDVLVCNNVVQVSKPQVTTEITM
jgi:hypothetical protein